MTSPIIRFLDAISGAIFALEGDKVYSSSADLFSSDEPPRGGGAIWTVASPDGRFEYVEALECEPAHMRTEGGVNLFVMPDALGNLPLKAFIDYEWWIDADASSAIQPWIDAHEEFSTLVFPNGTFFIKGPINFGKRNVVGQGYGTRLEFRNLKSDEDAVTLTSSTAGNGRAGKISSLVINMNNAGRDAVRWTGGLGCGARDVRVENAGGDAFHFEQDANFRFFERAFLEDCEVSGAGGFGLCIQLADFGPDDTQFFNKSRFVNCRLTGCQTADVGIILGDSDGGGSDTKIGGGIKFDNFHAQFHGEGPLRVGSAVFVQRKEGSMSKIDWITFEDCTFEWNAGDPDEDGALFIDNEAGGAPVIDDFTDRSTLLTGYGRWWDYSEDAPVGGVYRIQHPLLGTYTNDSQKWRGTAASLPGPTIIPAGGTVAIFKASEPIAWRVSVVDKNNAQRHLFATVVGGAAPVVADYLGKLGLTLAVDGSEVTTSNANSFQVAVHWSVTPLIG